ncbi:MAG: glycosyltransferase family 2 protein [Candidatus Obscuribacterales bacterium]|nr:glycosyltransferase family 2 protein [Candidatus Obscuribacterales bacterium]
MFNDVVREVAELQYAEVPDNHVEQPQVAILMATYNGGRYLDEQICSIAQQTHQNWFIVVSDDGSSDMTLETLERCRQRLGNQRVRVLKGPGRGFAANFLSLCCEPSIDAEFFAFCDQDDIWRPQHLERALAWLQNTQSTCPALHCGRTNLIGDSGLPYGASPIFDKPPTFHNALVQSLAGGNTMVFNAAARHLLRKAGPQVIVSHDWWVYMLVSGAGGNVCYAIEPSVDYRQHSGNLIGANNSWRDRLHRIRRMLAGHFKGWNELNLAALEQCQALLTEPHRQVMHHFSEARRANLLGRCIGVLRSGVYRQTWLGNIGLAVATLLGKL